MNEQIVMKVSIIIPVYKVSAYIADCLRSVYEQTYSCVEVILVNDATPDDSMEQAAPWIQKMQCRGYIVQVVNHPVNKGLSAARNTGIKAATADWIYFLDSDDELTPKCIELMVEQVKLHPSVDFVIGGVKVVGTNWKYPLTCRPYVDTNREILQDYIATKWYVMAWNHLYRKEYLLQNNLFFKEGIYHEDELYSFQVATTARAMAAVYENTYVYKIRSNGSITSQRKLKNFEDILSINIEKYDYILQQYKAQRFIIPFTYCIDIIDAFVCSLVSNQLVKFKDKMALISFLKKRYVTVIPYKKALNRRYEILSWFLRFPSSLIYLFAYFRLLLIRA